MLSLKVRHSAAAQGCLLVLCRGTPTARAGDSQEMGCLRKRKKYRRYECGGGAVAGLQAGGVPNQSPFFPEKFYQTGSISVL